MLYAVSPIVYNRGSKHHHDSTYCNTVNSIVLRMWQSSPCIVVISVLVHPLIQLLGMLRLGGA